MGLPQDNDLFKVVVGATQGSAGTGTPYSVKWSEMIAAAAASLLITDIELADSLSIYGTAAVQDVEYFATAAQGGLADTAIQQAALDAAIATRAAASHTHTLSEITDLGSLTITEAQISDLGSYLTDITGQSIGSLNNVTLDTVQNGEILRYSAGQFVNQTYGEAGISEVGHTHTISEVTGLQTQLDNKLEAADLSGYALTSYVDTQITNLINAAPGALDTLNEIASALGDDPNFAATMTSQLATKAPLASPALTGTPTAPTATGGTNTTQLATTAFVQSAISSLASALDDLTDVTITTVATGEILMKTATGWENQTLAEAGIQPAGFYAAASHTHAIGEITGFTDNSANWNTAHGWGDHAAAGYADGANEANWNTAFGWGDHAAGGYLAASAYTAADILTKLLTVDGATSNLDADLLDGQQGSYYLDYNNLINTPAGGGTGDAVLADDETVTGQWTFSNDIRVVGSIYGGPTAPTLGTRALHIRDDTDTVGDFVFQATDQKLRFQTYWESGVGQWASIQSTNDAESAQFGLLLNPDGGNVGIGTLTATSLLTVHGDIEQNAYKDIIAGTGNAKGRRQHRYNVAGSAHDYMFLNVNFDRDASGSGGTIDHTSLGTAEIALIATNAGNGAINFSVGAVNNAPATKVIIDGYGLGAGAAPVSGPNFTVGSSGILNKGFTVLGRGNAGWNTYGYEVAIDASSGTPPLIWRTGGATLGTVSTNGGITIYNTAGYGLSISATSGTDADGLLITTSANVANNAIVWNQNGASIMNLYSNTSNQGRGYFLGNLGIGTTSVAHPLTVNGHILAGSMTLEGFAPELTFNDLSSTSDYSIEVDQAQWRVQENGSTVLYMSGGLLYCVGTYNSTTAGSVNVRIGSSGGFQRSTSAAKYKPIREDLTKESVDKFFEVCAQPDTLIWYRSDPALTIDPEDHSYYGMLADRFVKDFPQLCGFGEPNKHGKREVEDFAYERTAPFVIYRVNEQEGKIKKLKKLVHRLEEIVLEQSDFIANLAARLEKLEHAA